VEVSQFCDNASGSTWIERYYLHVVRGIIFYFSRQYAGKYMGGFQVDPLFIEWGRLYGGRGIFNSYSIRIASLYEEFSSN
jgi:hypothetical protein